MNFKSIILNTISILMLIVIFLLIIFREYIDHFYTYYSDFKITIPMPDVKELIYSYQGIDHTNFEIWYYNTSEINKLKKKKYLEKITKENKKDIEQYYLDNLRHFGNVKEKIKSNFNMDEIISEGNYYALVVVPSIDDIILNTTMPYHKYLLLFLDINTNKAYVFELIM